MGENMKYLVRDCNTRPLACLLFGSAAWKMAPRDRFIGWNCQRREANLSYLTNNMRFLILPWVKVPHLASHILSRISPCICNDWATKYNHPVHLLKTLVDRTRFQGTCYKAANWILTGQTQGRTRNDRDRTMKVPPKDMIDCLLDMKKSVDEAKTSTAILFKEQIQKCEARYQNILNKGYNENPLSRKESTTRRKRGKRKKPKP